MLNKKIQLFFALSWTLLVAFLSLATINTKIASSFALPHKDKMVHFVFYFVFVLLWFLFKKSAETEKKTARFIFILAIAYGLLMELLQNILTTNRIADIFDVFANTLGAYVGLLFVTYKFLNKR